MDTCFVIQPFDGGKFDKRYSDVFKPAIENAGLEPYRVDQDPRVEIPIDSIEKEIKNSKLCLAEITNDNPNIWYELGYAMASGKSIILVCADDRKKFPFDIQHRHIITYKTESSSDFEELRQAITDRIKAILSKEDEIQHLAELPTNLKTEGLESHEFLVLATIMENQISPEDYVHEYTVTEDVSKAGYRSIAVSLAVRTLKKKGLISVTQEGDFNGNVSSQFQVTDQGESWLQNNIDKLNLRKHSPNKEMQPPSDAMQTPQDDEIPF